MVTNRKKKTFSRLKLELIAITQKEVNHPPSRSTVDPKQSNKRAGNAETHHPSAAQGRTTPRTHPDKAYWTVRGTHSERPINQDACEDWLVHHPERIPRSRRRSHRLLIQ